jgi:hypothetical protein
MSTQHGHLFFLHLAQNHVDYVNVSEVSPHSNKMLLILDLLELKMGVLEYNGIQDDYSLTLLASHKVPYSMLTPI